MSERERLRSLALLWFTMMAVAGVAWWGHQAPGPQGSTAPSENFSAARAETHLAKWQRAVPGPHLVGTRENERVRDLVAHELRGLGYPVEIQTERVCQGRRCARVSNIIAGPTDAPGAVVLAAHYDSVASGPGVSDDLASVAAIVEVARALKGAKTRHPIVYLITDGEEMGLFGAQAFRRHPLAKQARLVVNLEARGTRGRSFIFETSPAAGWLLGIAGSALSVPAVNSLAPAVYERLPNGSDLTVHRDQGFEGLNFGYFAEVAHYHTPLDDLEHLSRESLQHQGQNALEMTRALAQADHSELPPSKLVYFDVLGLWVVSWPEPWSLGLAIACLLSWCAAVGLGRRRERATLGGVLRVGAWGGLSFVVAIGLGLALDAGLASWRDHPLYWRGAREAAISMHALLTLRVMWSLAATVAKRTEMERWLGVWGLLTGLAVALAATLPAASYVFLAPCLVASPLGLLAAWRGHERAVSLAALGFGGVVWLTLMWSLLDGLELLSSALVTLPMWSWGLSAWVMGADASKRPRLVVGAVMTVAWLGLFLLVVNSARAVPERPEGMNILTAQVEGAANAEQYLYPMPLDMLGRKGPMPVEIFEEGESVEAHKTPVAPLARRSLRRTSAPALTGAAAPTLDHLGSFSSGQGHVIKVVSQRGATTMSVMLQGPGQVHWVPQDAESWGDERLLEHVRSHKSCGGFSQACMGLGGNSVVFGVPEAGLRLVVIAPEGAMLVVRDVAVSTPEELGALGQKRPDWMVPVHVGDLTLTQATRAIVP